MTCAQPIDSRCRIPALPALVWSGDYGFAALLNMSARMGCA